MVGKWIRVIHSDNGVLSDLSVDLADNANTALSLVADDDGLYIGQDFPFNNFFLELGTTVNDNASNMVVEYWNGSSWTEVVDLIDGTKTAGKTMAKSGVVMFSPDKNSSWTRINDTSEQSADFVINSLTIYNLYWLRIKVSADITPSTQFKKLAYAFCLDEHLTSIHPEINSFLTSWATGKTNWIEQIMLASNHIVADLKGKDFILNNGQIIRFDDLYLPTAYKAIEIIFWGLGAQYRPLSLEARSFASELLSIKRFTFDIFKNAMTEVGEVSGSVGKLIR